MRTEHGQEAATDHVHTTWNLAVWCQDWEYIFPAQDWNERDRAWDRRPNWYPNTTCCWCGGYFWHRFSFAFEEKSKCCFRPWKGIRQYSFFLGILPTKGYDLREMWQQCVGMWSYPISLNSAYGISLALPVSAFCFVLSLPSSFCFVVLFQFPECVYSWGCYFPFVLELVFDINLRESSINRPASTPIIASSMTSTGVARIFYWPRYPML